MFALLIGCVLIPRLALVTALGAAQRAEMLGQPLALAPEPGGPQVVGEVSGAAEAFGIHAGMRLGEALSRCPGLALVPPDPERAAEAWEEALVRLEAIGAAVEPARPGEAFFGLDGLRALWGDAQATLARAARALRGPDRGERPLVPRFGAAPTPLCAYAAALRARPRRGPVIVPAGAARTFLAAQPIGLLRGTLRGEWERASIPDTLERLGIKTLGELASLPDDAVADRFSEPGLRALRMARGSEAPLRPRAAHEPLAERLALPEACSGQQLERALGLLLDRLLARPARRGRALRKLRVGARLSGGGSWGAEVTFRTASADRRRIELALLPKLSELPGPAAALSLRAIELGSPAHAQPSLARSPEARRRERIGEAIRQVRAAAGRDAVLHVLEVEPDSRVPERRVLLTPFPVQMPPASSAPASGAGG